MKTARFNSIEGVEGNVPFGAIVSCGHKGPRGNPVNTDRFFISARGFEEISQGGGSGFRNLKHPLDPRFSPFNNLDNSNPSATVLRGNIMFPRRDQSVNHQLVARQLGSGTGVPSGGGVWETPPRSMPACRGDGVTAERYDGIKDGEPSFVEIDCPNRLCVFRLGSKKICGAFGRLYFNLSWAQGTQDALVQRSGEGLPSILVRYQTHAWDTVSNMVGMFDAVEATADGLGLDPDSWCFTGLPFEMSVGMKRVPDKGRKFPVVAFALGSIVDFLRWQVDQRQHLLSAPKSVAMLGDGSSPVEVSREEIGQALDHITPGYGIPASTGGGVVDAEVIAPEAPAVKAYVVTPGDPRSPYERLRAHCVEALNLEEVVLLAACRSVGGCEPREVTPMFEGAIADELDKVSSGEGQ